MTPPPAAAAVAVPGTHPAPARPSVPRGPARARPGTQRRPRRVSAPARRAAPAQAVAARLGALDRLIASRAWIGLVAFALIGIVAMQLWLLKLNTGIGRAIEHEALLQRTNAALSAEDSAMSAGDLVENRASSYGMTLVPSGSLVFLHTRGQLDERQAAARLAQPAPAPTATPAAATQPIGTSTPTSAETAVSSTTGAQQPAETAVSGTPPTTTGASAPISMTSPSSTPAQATPGG